jgi:signal peptidase I
LEIGERFLIKRIAALPGDLVPGAARDADVMDRVPVGRLVLLGDNTNASFDSRDPGCCQMSDIHAITIRK